MKKKFKEGDEVYIKGKVAEKDFSDKYKLLVYFDNNEQMSFTTDGIFLDGQKTTLQHLSSLQTNVFTDDELEMIYNYMKEFDINDTSIYWELRQSILTKINQLTISQEEKEFLEMVEKLGYKVEKI